MTTPTAIPLIRLARRCLPALLLFSASGPLPARPAAGDDRVMVIGALHGLHEREPAFDYARLRAAIVAFRPDVLVLEVRPDELAERKETPGRPEYPAVIWPLLDRLRVRAVAMEPGGNTFQAIASAAGAAFADFKRRDSAGAAALATLDTAVEEALLAYWQRPGQVQDQTTAALVSGAEAARFALVGGDFSEAQRRWDAYMADQAVQAVGANPAARVLVIASYKNRAMLERSVREAAPERALSASDWFGAVSAPATGSAADKAD